MKGFLKQQYLERISEDASGYCVSKEEEEIL